MTALGTAIGRPFAPLARWRARAASLPRPATYLLLAATIAVLNVVGVVMVLSASSVASLTNYGSAWHFFERQLAWTALGGIVFVAVARVDYHAWRRWVRALLLVTTGLLVAVLVPGIGIYVAGSRRWLGTTSLAFQPSELAKLAVLVFTADLLARRADEVDDWHRVLRPVLLVFGVLGVLVLREPDLDSTLVLAMIAAAIVVAGGVRLRHLAVTSAVGVALGTALALAEPYRRARLLAFRNPWADPGNTGYQISQSLIAVGSGGWGGVGLGAGRAKWLFLPNAHTDFVFATLGEELGLIGCLLVIGLFIAFAVLGTRAALRAPDRFGTLLAAGVTIWVVGQAAINIAAVIGLLPVAGIPLPFVSYGGSAVVFTMAAAGILGNVARQGR